MKRYGDDDVVDDDDDGNNIVEEAKVRLIPEDVFLEKVKKLKYLGSSVCMDEDLDEEQASRIKARWMNFPEKLQLLFL